jgi:hypothetical protein
VPAERERERDPEAVQRRGTRAEQPQQPGHLVRSRLGHLATRSHTMRLAVPRRSRSVDAFHQVVARIPRLLPVRAVTRPVQSMAGVTQLATYPACQLHIGTDRGQQVGDPGAASAIGVGVSVHRVAEHQPTLTPNAGDIVSRRPVVGYRR